MLFCCNWGKYGGGGGQRERGSRRWDGIRGEGGREGKIEESKEGERHIRRIGFQRKMTQKKKKIWRWKGEVEITKKKNP
jgi:hypothetical protein